NPGDSGEAKHCEYIVRLESIATSEPEKGIDRQQTLAKRSPLRPFPKPPTVPTLAPKPGERFRTILPRSGKNHTGQQQKTPGEQVRASQAPPEFSCVQFVRHIKGASIGIDRAAQEESFRIRECRSRCGHQQTNCRRAGGYK